MEACTTKPAIVNTLFPKEVSETLEPLLSSLPPFWKDVVPFLPTRLVFCVRLEPVQHVSCTGSDTQPTGAQTKHKTMHGMCDSRNLVAPQPTLWVDVHNTDTIAVMVVPSCVGVLPANSQAMS
jgi:hypothetical protein